MKQKSKIKKLRIPLPQKIEKVIPDKKKEDEKLKCRKKIRIDRDSE